VRFAVVGAGAVGGYFGAKLARAGHDVTFVARGAHLAAIRAHGLAITSVLGDFVARADAVEDPGQVPPVDAVIFAVKAYSNPGALPLVAPLARGDAVVLTLQNGVDSVDEVAAAVGPERVLGGSAYIATALAQPGRIEQTGVHRRIVFGEIAGAGADISDRVRRLSDAFAGADIISEPVADARVPIWEKFCYLAPFAAFTGAARLPLGPLWADADARRMLVAAFREAAAVAAGCGVPLAPDLVDRIVGYVNTIPGATRSSLLIDLQQGKPIEVEALPGAVVRRGVASDVPTPIMAALYAVLKPHAAGAVRDVR
jgi:2-dehydropantoate 2-reductase